MNNEIRHLHVDDLTVAYTWTGEESPAPIVFLHGLGDSSIITFRPIAAHPALAGSPALLIDLPGFGYSSAPDTWPATIEMHADVVGNVLNLLGIPHAQVVGHSMGGSIALVLAGRRPGLVSRLVLAEPLLRLEDSQLAKAIARRDEDDFVARGFHMLQLATRRQANRGEWAAIGFQEPLRQAGPAIMHRSAISLLAHRSPSFLQLLRDAPMPRTLLIGEKTKSDPRIVPAGVATIRIPNAGHSMMNENPDALAQALRGAISIDHQNSGSR